MISATLADHPARAEAARDAALDQRIVASTETKRNMGSFFRAVETACLRRSDDPAVIFCSRDHETSALAYRSMTFTSLLRRSDTFAEQLVRLGIRPKSTVAFSVHPTSGYAELLFALFRIGSVPVFIDATMDLSGMSACMSECAPTHLIGDSHFVNHYMKHRGSLSAVEGIIEVSSREDDVVLRFERPEPLAVEAGLPPDSGFEEEDPLCIFYTTGSTGIPKGVVWTNEILLQHLRIQEKLYGSGDDHIDLVTFPFFMLTALAQGRTCVLPPVDFSSPAAFDPSVLVEVMNTTRATYCFASPVVWHNIIDFCRRRGTRIPGLRYTTSAGATVPLKTVRGLVDVAPNAKVCVPFGATEAILPISTIDAVEICEETWQETDAGKGICLGRPVPGLTVSVIPIVDHPISTLDEATVLNAGQVGELIVKGPTVTTRYHRRPEATRRAKIHETLPDGRVDVWHRLGDAGYIDSKGRVWYCGRITFGIEVDGAWYFPDQVEAVFNAALDVYRTAATTFERDGSTAIALAVQKEREGACSNDVIYAKIIDISKKYGFPIEAVYFYDDAFPVDPRHNVKIERDRIRQHISRTSGTAVRDHRLFVMTRCAGERDKTKGPIL
ncbi:AMP-binding protein [Sorangium sp. So ce367]|uniref:AMP-binding protein n=1 Tax=Sorangium sp. So ce367 TaxID=3133305 RepID=UPI003F639C9F